MCNFLFVFWTGIETQILINNVLLGSTFAPVSKDFCKVNARRTDHFKASGAGASQGVGLGV